MVRSDQSCKKKHVHYEQCISIYILTRNRMDLIRTLLYYLMNMHDTFANLQNI